MLLVSRVYLRKQRGQRMCASGEFLLRQLLFVNSTWTAPCTIHIFHPQEDVNQCQDQNIANLFSRNSNLKHAIHDVMNACGFGFFSGEFCDCRSTLYISTKWYSTAFMYDFDNRSKFHLQTTSHFFDFFCQHCQLAQPCVWL